MKPRILVVDDKQDLALGVAMVLRELSDDIVVAHSGQQALVLMQAQPADIVLTDVRMPGLDGTELLAQVRERWPRTLVILLTAFGNVSAAVAAMQQGAFHYLTKPFDNEELLNVVQRAWQALVDRDDVVALRSELEKGESFHGIVSRDPRMLNALTTVRRAAVAATTVLVFGESGTGKELVARALHESSPRRAGPFVAFSAAAVSENIAEAELFGAKRGAYTGSDRDRKGLFVEADGGTLFIDEASSMPAALQSKLLRAIQEREVLPVGAGTPVKVDVRIVTATNVEPKRLLAEGLLRKDLYYRLAVVRVHLPPLRERAQDIPLLANLFVQRTGGGKHTLTAATLRMLQAHDWPGNVRELQNVIEHAVVMSTGEEISPADILLDDDEAPWRADDAAALSYEEAKKAVIARFQQRYVEQLLAETGHNLSAAARKAGLTRAALYRIARRLGIATSDGADAG